MKTWRVPVIFPLAVDKGQLDFKSGRPVKGGKSGLTVEIDVEAETVKDAEVKALAIAIPWFPERANEITTGKPWNPTTSTKYVKPIGS